MTDRPHHSPAHLGGGATGGSLGQLLDEAGIHPEQFRHNQTTYDRALSSAEGLIHRQPLLVLGLMAGLGLFLGMTLMPRR